MTSDKMRLLRVNLYCTEEDFREVRDLSFKELENRLRIVVSSGRRGNNAFCSVRVIPVLSSETTCDIFLTAYDESKDLITDTDLGEEIVKVIKGSLSMIDIPVISVEQVKNPCFIGYGK